MSASLRPVASVKMASMLPSSARAANTSTCAQCSVRGAHKSPPKWRAFRCAASAGFLLVRGFYRSETARRYERTKRRRVTPAVPIKPVASSTRLEGSGVTAVESFNVNELMAKSVFVALKVMELNGIVLWKPM